MQPSDETLSVTPESGPRIVVLAGDSPIRAFLIQEIGRRCKISAIVRPIKARHKNAPVRKTLIEKIGSRIHGRFYGWHARRLGTTISRELFGSPVWPSFPTHEIPDREINRSGGVRLLNELQPDLLLVCGAPILKSQVYSIPTIGAVNLHFGIAPKYRGQNTLFWALYHRDYEHLGFTLHRIDSGVDTGAVIAKGYPELNRDDTEATLWAKCVRMAGTVLTEFLVETQARGQFAAVSQTGDLRVYREQDRTVWRDLHFAWKRRILNQRPRGQPAKIERFYQDAF
jgi:folate-dependent phosphoribosylglycinamide formyltransferase PurN